MKSALFALVLCVSSSVIAAPVALVEDVIGNTDVAAFDFLDAGMAIDLGSVGELRVSYLESCISETIVGGMVTIGERQSETNSENVERVTNNCDGGGLVLAANTAVHSGAVAMRDVEEQDKPDMVLHHTSPLILFSSAGKLSLKRLDQPGERYRFRVTIDDVENRKAIDFLQEGISLHPGARYMLSGGGNSVIFRIADDAVRDGGSVVSRLLPL